MTEFDGIVVGGGHNGLTCAAYLARAGLSVAVVERNEVAGGGCSTQELTLPGFRHNTHSNYHFLEEGPVPADLELHRYGLRYVYPEVQHATVFRDGRAITVYTDPKRTAESFARFSRADAERWLELYERYAEAARGLMNGFLYSRPLPPPVLAERLRGDLGRDLLSYVPLALRGRGQELRERPGQGAVQVVPARHLHRERARHRRLLPRLLSRITRLGLPVGGSANVAHALRQVIEEHGGTVVTGRHVERILVDDGRATGVGLAAGGVLTARRFVASAVDAPRRCGWRARTTSAPRSPPRSRPTSGPGTASSPCTWPWTRRRATGPPRSSRTWTGPSCSCSAPTAARIWTAPSTGSTGACCRTGWRATGRVPPCSIPPTRRTANTWPSGGRGPLRPRRRPGELGPAP
nr:hypothetical protein GCM10020093_047780 [Planobispora longispora]